MIIDELVTAELQRLKPQLTAGEWQALVEVLRASLQRIAHAAYFAAKNA